MPDDIVRWRAANGRTGQFRRTGSRSRGRPAAAPAPVRAVRAAASTPTPPTPQPPAGIADLRARLGMPATATAEQVVAAAAERLAPRPAAPVAAAPAPPATVLTPEQLLEESRWEEVDQALFGIQPGPGSATERLAAMGAPTPEQARSDVAAAREAAWRAEFDRNQEADRRAGELTVDATRAGRGRVAAEDRAARERAQDLLLWPELGR